MLGPISEGSSVNLEFCRILGELSQLSSLVSRRLSTARALRRRLETLVTTVSELHDQLDAVRRRVDSALYLNSRFSPNIISGAMTLQQVVYLRYLFFSITLDIHTTMTCPSAYAVLDLTADVSLLTQAHKSAQIVAETCRNSIQLTEYIHLNAGTPHTYAMLP